MFPDLWQSQSLCLFTVLFSLSQCKVDFYNFFFFYMGVGGVLLIHNPSGKLPLAILRIRKFEKQPTWLQISGLWMAKTDVLHNIFLSFIFIF